MQNGKILEIGRATSTIINQFKLVLMTSTYIEFKHYNLNKNKWMKL